MGLDMFAYSVKAELVGDDQVDIPVFDRAAQAVGYVAPTEEEFRSYTGEQIQKFYDYREQIQARIKAEGLVDQSFAYWRKFNHLHGWMEQLYRRKGGTKNFNRTTVRLMPEDLHILTSLATMKALPPTVGFFFGSYKDFNDDDRDSVLEFVRRANAEIANGRAVLYDSWW